MSLIQAMAKEKVEHNDLSAKSSRRRKSGIVRLLGSSAILMSLLIPIGVVPKLMEAHERDDAHDHLVAKLPAVTVATAEAAPSQRELKLPGSIDPILEASIYARANGYVTQRKVDIGDRVQAGQVLALIDTPEVEQDVAETQALVATNEANKINSEANRERAQADLDRADAEVSQAKASLIEKQANERLAKSTFLRWKSLGAQGAVSSQDVDERQTRYQTSMAETAAARDRIKAAQSNLIAGRAKLKAESANVSATGASLLAARARAKRSSMEKSFQQIVSPFTGVVTERNFDTGSLVSSGSDSSKVALYRLARIDTVRAFVDVPQYASSGVKLGQAVEVHLKEFPARSFKGIVARTSVALDPAARTMRTEIHLSNSDFALAPGMYADVTIKVHRASNTILVPANTIVNRPQGEQVALVDTTNHVHFKTVVVGEDLGKFVEVTSGLSAADKLVINPSDSVTEGAQVAISTQN